jgi:hypothetical protein
MSQAVQDALESLDPTAREESVEELLAAAETALDLGYQEARRQGGNVREPRLMAVALLGAALYVANATANPARVLSRDELAEELEDATTLVDQRRIAEPVRYPLDKAFQATLHGSFLELHRLNGRRQRLNDPQSLYDLLARTSTMAGEIASELDRTNDHLP